MTWPPFKAVLDANVLFPPLLRDILLRAAEKGLYQPYWSSKTLDELERVLAREGHVDAEAARRARAQIERAFSSALFQKRSSRASSISKRSCRTIPAIVTSPLRRR